MKNLILTLLFVLLSTTLSTTETEIQKGDYLDRWMIELYPNWWDFKEKDRSILRKMFLEDSDKHAWFPDKFEKPPVKKFTIYPRNYLDKEIKSIQENDIRTRKDSL